MHDEIPDWVKSRGECSFKSQFQALYVQVKKDVSAVNSLSRGRRKGYKFTLEGKPEDGTFVVYSYMEDNSANRSANRVRFDQNLDSMMFERPDEKRILICPKWDKEEVRCDLIMEGKACELWKISRAALEDYFFGLIGD